MRWWLALPMLVLTICLLAGGCVSLVPYDRLVADVASENLLAISGGRVYVEDSGEGPAVLLVHGFGGSSYSWREVNRELSSEYRVVAVDLAGFGLTERPRRKRDYSRHAQGELLIEVLDALDIEQAHLVGHSYGGSVSVALALRQPERVLSLTLVNSAAPEYPRLRRSAFSALRPLTHLFVRTRSLRRSNVEAALRRSVANDERVTDDLIDEYWRRLAVEGSPRAFWGLTTPLRDPQGEISATDLRVPTLLIWGEDDVLIPPEGARQTAASLPAGRFQLIPEAGHAPMEDQPIELASLMSRFFTGGLAAFD